MTLRRPWWDRYGEVAFRTPSYVPSWSRTAYLATCSTFISEHAAEAERHGWQPAHLMGPRGLGMAWVGTPDSFEAWWCPERIAWGRHTMLYVLRGTPVVRRASRDGAIQLVTGGAYVAELERCLAFLVAERD